jgi:Bifunctional DNA primase/polymerase, N-terminal
MVTAAYSTLDASSPLQFPLLSCHEAAVTYAHQGIPVFPVCGKVPYPRTRGFHDACTDPDVIGWWWRRWPDANVAVPTGAASRWIALDIDGRHGGFASLTHLKAMRDHHLEGEPALPATRIARTGSGMHMIFQPPSTVLRNTVEYAGLPGIDVRGEGGYIVVAPSIHPNGHRYRWLSLMTPAPFPALLLDLLHRREQLRRQQMSRSRTTSSHTPTSSYEDPDYWLTKAVDCAWVGTRHRSALWLACRLIAQAHLSPQQAERYMHDYVERVPGDDYPLSDALHCLQWAAAHV